MRLHGGSLVAASDSIHNPNQGTVRVTEPSHPKFKYGVGKSKACQMCKVGVSWPVSIAAAMTHMYDIKIIIACFHFKSMSD